MARRPTFFQRPDRITEPLYVVTSVFNSPRFRTRWKLYQDFATMVKEADAILYTVEVAFGDREFVIDPDPEHPERLLQLRTSTELWLKENALNLLVQWLTAHEPCWKYVATLDADIRFARHDWDDEIIQALQHFAVVQPWTQAVDLSSDYEVVPGSLRQSFGWAVLEGVPLEPRPYYYGGGYPYGGVHAYATGLAWAYRRDIWDGLGGLLDTPIIGSADYYMAYAMVGLVDKVVPHKVHPRYREIMLEWQARAEAVVKRNIGATKGLVMHYWHGPKVSRRYSDRNSIITDTQFNPDTDLRRDAQGLYQLSHRSDPRMLKLRDLVRQYFHQRREDDPSS